MKGTLSKLDELQNLMNLEIENYKLAIIKNKPFSEVKAIYLRIKDLKKESLTIMQEANSKIEKSEKE